jgi:hypothetical protein
MNNEYHLNIGLIIMESLGNDFLSDRSRPLGQVMSSKNVSFDFPFVGIVIIIHNCYRMELGSRILRYTQKDNNIVTLSSAKSPGP